MGKSVSVAVLYELYMQCRGTDTGKKWNKVHASVSRSTLFTCKLNSHGRELGELGVCTTRR